MVASLKGPQRRLSWRRVIGGFAGFALLEPLLAAFGFALLAALSKPVLYRPGVADLLNGKAGDHHDLLRTEEREPLSQHRQHNRVQIRAAGEDLLTAGGQLALGSQRQGEQVQQRIEIWLLAQLLQADPVHLRQKLPAGVGVDGLVPACGAGAA